MQYNINFGPRGPYYTLGPGVGNPTYPPPPPLSHGPWVWPAACEEASVYAIVLCICTLCTGTFMGGSLPAITPCSYMVSPFIPPLSPIPSRFHHSHPSCPSCCLPNIPSPPPTLPFNPLPSSMVLNRSVHCAL